MSEVIQNMRDLVKVGLPWTQRSQLSSNLLLSLVDVGLGTGCEIREGNVDASAANSDGVVYISLSGKTNTTLNIELLLNDGSFKLNGQACDPKTIGQQIASLFLKNNGIKQPSIVI